MVSGRKGGKRSSPNHWWSWGRRICPPSKLLTNPQPGHVVHGEPCPLSFWTPTFAMAAPLLSPGIPGSTPTCITCCSLVVNSLNGCLHRGPSSVTLSMAVTGYGPSSLTDICSLPNLMRTVHVPSTQPVPAFTLVMVESSGVEMYGRPFRRTKAFDT